MNGNDTVTLKRDVAASVIPVGTRVTLQAGETAHITQTLGGTYTVVVNGNLFRIEAADADALGVEPAANPPSRLRRWAVPLTPPKWRRMSGSKCGVVTTRKFRSTSWTWG